MTEKKGWGNTVLGWFIVNENDPQNQAGFDSGLLLPDSIVDAVDARSTILPPLPRTTPPLPPRPGTPRPSGAALPPLPGAPPQPVIFDKEPPPAKGGAVEFARVFEAASIKPDEQDRVSKAVDLLHSLPADTDPAVKKQIVEASLKAFGVPIDKIIETGVAEVQALEGYIRAGASATQKRTDDSEARIKALEAEIAQRRSDMQSLVTEQQALIRSCNDKKLEIQQILEFFGQERVAKVVQDSPKLHDPKQLP